MSQAADQLVIQHLNELRRRLLLSIFCLVASAAVAYFYRVQLITFFTSPIHNSLIYTAPSGGFQFLMQICLAVGIVAALPVFLYNLIKFILPAFDQLRFGRKHLASLVAVSYLLALAGIGFAYWLVIPMSLHFFASFEIGGVRALISTSDYFAFILGCFVSFAIIFQLPLLLLAYNSINRFPPGGLARYRRHVFVASLVVALVLPFTYDPVTQFIVAIPAVVLYELSILAVWASNRRQNKSTPPLMPDLNTRPLQMQGIEKMPRKLDRKRPFQLG